jgi:biopolymer transport protein ExbD
MSYPVSKSNRKQLRKPRGKRDLKAFRPQLTSLVDVMTIMLVYLLKSFSTEGEIITVSKELMLPESSADKRPSLTAVVMVNNSYILMGDESRPVAFVDEVLASDELVIPGLAAKLRERRTTTTKIGKYSDDVEFKGEVTIQGDRRIRFRLLKKIMYTCGQEGFNTFYLAVQSRQE